MAKYVDGFVIACFCNAAFVLIYFWATGSFFV